MVAMTWPYRTALVESLFMLLCNLTILHFVYFGYWLGFSIPCICLHGLSWFSGVAQQKALNEGCASWAGRSGLSAAVVFFTGLFSVHWLLYYIRDNIYEFVDMMWEWLGSPSMAGLWPVDGCASCRGYLIPNGSCKEGETLLLCCSLGMVGYCKITPVSPLVTGRILVGYYLLAQTKAFQCSNEERERVCIWVCVCLGVCLGVRRVYWCVYLLLKTQRDGHIKIMSRQELLNSSPDLKFTE